MYTGISISKFKPREKVEDIRFDENQSLVTELLNICERCEATKLNEDIFLEIPIDLENWVDKQNQNIELSQELRKVLEKYLNTTICIQVHN